MTSATQADIAVSPAWTNIVSANAALANADVCIQNKAAYGDQVFVVFGGVSAPASATAGIMLNRFDSVSGKAAAIWVRCINAGPIGVTLL